MVSLLVFFLPLPLPLPLPLALALLFSFTSSPVLGNAELTALLAIKSSLDPDGHFLASWSASGDHCGGSFEGVACNRHGMVANISLQGKGLTGFLSPAVSQLPSLSGLYLHYNSIRGDIPKEISELTELSDLYLNMNKLSGGIPAEIGNIVSLQVLQLSYNQLTGSIPTQLGKSQNLSVLALQSNQLTGAIPASLGGLSMLTRIDLSYNQLFGSIPKKLADVPRLEFLDVTNNTLSGNVPPALNRLSQGFVYENNTGLCGVGFKALTECNPSDQLNPNQPEPFGADAKTIPESVNVKLHGEKTNCPNSAKSPAVTLTLGIIALLVGVVVCGLFAFSCYRRRKQKIGSASEHTDSRLSTDQPKDVYRKSGSPLANVEYSNGWDPLADDRNREGLSQEVLHALRFNLEEVELATQYFSEVNLLWKSNHAATYKGMLRDGSLVVVKRFSKTSCKSEEVEFLKGLKILISLQHENLVRLKGFCCSKARGECFLVYDFVVNGSLVQYLDSRDGSGKVLDWSTRVSIIHGVVKAIRYLHASNPSRPSLVHQNISAQKILLDKHFKPLLSDSGFHKLLANNAIFSTIKNSAAMGYLAPEYTTIGRFTDKSDIYAFGVVILQILSGKTRITPWLRPSAECVKVAELIDDNLNGKFSEYEAEILVKIGSQCTSEIPCQRPSMEVLMEELGKCDGINT